MALKGFSLIIVLLFLLAGVSVFSLTFGPADISAGESIGIIAGRLIPGGTSFNPSHETIVLDIRLPRILLAIIVGAGLAVAGVILQALFKNPLADPYIIGVSSGAALGATIAIFLQSILLLPVFGFFGGLVTMYAVYLLGRTGRRLPIVTLLLAGVVINIFLSALITMVMVLMSAGMHKVMFWLMGSLVEPNTMLIWLLALVVGFGIAVAFALNRDLDALLLGEATAHHLGVNVEKTKKILFFVTALVCGAVVSVSGLIGFVGLVIPHIVRLLFGPKHVTLIPASALIGAIFLVSSDAVARTIIAPSEIPIGVVTALVGGPFFLFLLLRKKAKEAV